MNVFLIILLTILVTATASVNFHPEHNKTAIKQLGTSGRKAKAIAHLIDIYPGFHLFLNLLSLLSITWIACLAALTWGMLAGCFIALVVIALAQLLGARLTKLTDQIIIERASFIVQYFSWTGLLNSLVTERQTEPIEDTEELVKALHRSHIDCPTQLLIEKVLHLHNQAIGQLATRWDKVQKVSYKEKLTPLHIDELYKSGQKIFPVIRNDDNDVVGLLHLTDVSTVGQTEKKLLDSMHRNFASCEYGTTIPTALRLMADNETTVVVVMKGKKIYGIVNLTDILATDPVCPAGDHQTVNQR